MRRPAEALFSIPVEQSSSVVQRSLADLSDAPHDWFTQKSPQSHHYRHSFQNLEELVVALSHMILLFLTFGRFCMNHQNNTMHKMALNTFVFSVWDSNQHIKGFFFMQRVFIDITGKFFPHVHVDKMWVCLDFYLSTWVKTYLVTNAHCLIVPAITKSIKPASAPPDRNHFACTGSQYLSNGHLIED